MTATVRRLLASEPVPRPSPLFTSACACALLGCYGSSTVVGAQTAALHRSEQGDGSVLVADDGSPVRLDGDSELRFTRTDGTWTDWIGARDLLVNDDGVFLKPDDDQPLVDGLKWSDVKSVEVKNLDRGETMIAVVAISAAVVGLIVVAMKSKGNLPLPNLNHVDFHVNASSNGGGGGGGDAAVPTPGGESVLAEPTLEAPNASGAKDLLDGDTRRRSVVEVVGALEGGGETTGSGLRLGTAMLALRAFDFLDFGVGARWISFGLVDGRQAYVLPVFRFGMHADLDAHRRIALVFGVEMGASHDVLDHVRVDWGIRCRVYDEMWLGVDPLTPIYDRFASGIHGPAWSAPTTLLVGFAF